MTNRRHPAVLSLTLLLGVLILFSLGACSSSGDETVQEPPPETTSPPTTPPPTTPPPTTPPPTTPPPAVVVAKIMPLGDSITASSVGLPSYRYFLWHLAVNNGYHIDFVGSLSGPPTNSDFDMDHEGHGGFSADQLLPGINQWATAASPDIVLLHIGHNDLHEFHSVQSTVDNIGSIIDRLRAVNPKIRILLAQLIASSDPRHKDIPALNAQLPALVVAKNSVKSPIVLVDQFTGFDPATMTTEGVHPNAIGESRMADRWFEKLAPMLNAFP